MVNWTLFKKFIYFICIIYIYICNLYLINFQVSFPSALALSLKIFQIKLVFSQDLKDYMRQAGDVTFSQCHKDSAGEG